MLVYSYSCVTFSKTCKKKSIFLKDSYNLEIYVSNWLIWFVMFGKMTSNFPLSLSAHLSDTEPYPTGGPFSPLLEQE